MRLLVADDDPSLRLALRLVLEDAGHEVVEAESVEAARSIVGSAELDFALIDAGMCQEGVDLWNELESGERYRGRALLLTGDLMALGLLSRHRSVLAKPFDFDGLLSRIEDAGPRPSGEGPDRRGGEDGRPGEDPPDDMVVSS